MNHNPELYQALQQAAALVKTARRYFPKSIRNPVLACFDAWIWSHNLLLLVTMRGTL